MRSCSLVALLTAGLLIGTLPAGPAKKAGPRGLAVEEINDHPGFMVRVSVDKPDRVYKGGEVMTVTVRSERAGYLYLFYCDAGDRVSCVFPNRVQKDNLIPANKDVVVPAAGARFRLRITPPFGWEVLKAVVTSHPLKLAGMETKRLSRADATPVEEETFAKVFAEARERSKEAKAPLVWAEHLVRVYTVDPKGRSAGPGPRRMGLFVGASENARHKQLRMPSAAADAAGAEKAFKRYGELNQTWLLTGKDATRANMEKAVRKQLVEASRPGDVVFIYYSGHGGRCANEDGTEKDGLDEYLVTYDTRLTGPESVHATAVLDDAFGRWVQDLDGRKVVVILDCCYGAGHSSGGKGVAGGKKEGGKVFNFLDRMLRRAKDLGQKEIALLASSKADELSFVRKEKDYGVMTWCLLDALGRSKPGTTLPQLFPVVKANTVAYVTKHRPGAKQTPTLIDYTTPPLVVVPMQAVKD
jgi:hypothetical protein